MDDEEDAPAKRRPWGPEEDAQLRKLVVFYGIKSGGDCDQPLQPEWQAAKEHAKGYCFGIALGPLFASPAVAWRHRHVPPRDGRQWRQRRQQRPAAAAAASSGNSGSDGSDRAAETDRLTKKARRTSLLARA